MTRLPLWTLLVLFAGPAAAQETDAPPADAVAPSPDEAHCFAPDRGKNQLVVHGSSKWDSPEVDRIKEDQVFYGLPVVFEGKAENKILVHIPGDPIRQICNERCYAGIVRRTEVREIGKAACQGPKLYTGTTHKGQKK